MRYRIYYSIVFAFLILLSPIYDLMAQKKNLPEVEAYELLEQAKTRMQEGNFQQANLIFRKMLRLKSVLPTEMSYLFAETLFKVGQYENSKNFLEKYQQLTDRGSDYYLLSVELEKQIDAELAKIADCKLCNHAGYLVEPCNVCQQTGKAVQECPHCRGKGIVSCSICVGAGVVITTNQFNEKEYRSCGKCDAKGVLDCPVCDGTKEISSDCLACDGSGHQPTNQLCDHLSATNPSP